MFTKCFGHRPRWIAAAPGRVNLIGEHTDYNDGFVLPMAIERHTVFVADRSPERQATLHNITTGDTASFSLRGPVKSGDPSWSNYVRGVVAGFQGLGVRVGGFDAVIDSSLPYGGGLASSAAVEVAAATLLEGLCGKSLEPLQKALLCQHAEHTFAGVPCGIMDQYTSVLARKDHALLLDCRSRETTLVKMNDPSVTVLILNTHVRHRLAETEYARRRAQCEAAAGVLRVPALRDATLADLEEAKERLDPVTFRRARHVITENARTLQMADAIQRSDWELAGLLMYQSHESLATDYEVSCAELNAAVDIARRLGKSAGVLGCRMTGAGFGGCVVSLVRTEMLASLTRKFEELYEQKTRRQPEIFSSRPANGAHLL